MGRVQIRIRPVDADRLTREHVNLPCDAGRFLKLIKPYREQAAESSIDVWCVAQKKSEM